MYIKNIYTNNDDIHSHETPRHVSSFCFHILRPGANQRARVRGSSRVSCSKRARYRNRKNIDPVKCMNTKYVLRGWQTISVVRDNGLKYIILLISPCNYE